MILNNVSKDSAMLYRDVFAGGKRGSRLLIVARKARIAHEIVIASGASFQPALRGSRKRLVYSDALNRCHFGTRP